ncbi:MAG: SAM-dependent methyltransferase [Myxococcota bacterium]|jgi:SAM-dependent methyltransferase
MWPWRRITAILGTGTGTVARGLARRGGRVIGLDPSKDLMEVARGLDREAGVTIRYRLGTAEATGLPDSSQDVVTAGQCWHWFDGDAAAREIRRILSPGGRLVICHFDWLPLPGTVPEATEALILKHNPAWAWGGLTGLYPRWLTDVASAGFEDIETFSYDVQQPYTHTDWCGRIRASSGIAASLDADAVQRFDSEHESLLAERFPTEPLEIPHRVWALVCRHSG